jgi:hypothetical protein
MRRGMMALPALWLLTACDGFAPAGAHLPPPDAALTAPCAHPSRHLDAGDWEIVAGRIGDDLIACGAAHAALAAWAAGVAQVMGPGR